MSNIVDKHVRVTLTATQQQTLLAILATTKQAMAWFFPAQLLRIDDLISIRQAIESAGTEREEDFEDLCWCGHRKELHAARIDANSQITETTGCDIRGCICIEFRSMGTPYREPVPAPGPAPHTLEVCMNCGHGFGLHNNPNGANYCAFPPCQCKKFQAAPPDDAVRKRFWLFSNNHWNRLRAVCNWARGVMLETSDQEARGHLKWIEARIDKIISAGEEAVAGAEGMYCPDPALFSIGELSDLHVAMKYLEEANVTSSDFSNKSRMARLSAKLGRLINYGFSEKPAADPDSHQDSPCKTCGHARQWHLQDSDRCTFRTAHGRPGGIQDFIACTCQKFVWQSRVNTDLPADFAARLQADPVLAAHGATPTPDYRIGIAHEILLAKQLDSTRTRSIAEAMRQDYERGRAAAFRGAVTMLLGFENPNGGGLSHGVVYDLARRFKEEAAKIENMLAEKG